MLLDERAVVVTCGWCWREFSLPQPEYEARKAVSPTGLVFCGGRCTLAANRARTKIEQDPRGEDG